MQQKLTVRTVEKYLFGDAPNVDSSEETTAVPNVALLDRRRHLRDLFIPKYALDYLLFLKINMFWCSVQTYSNPSFERSFASLKLLLTFYYYFLTALLEQFFLLQS